MSISVAPPGSFGSKLSLNAAELPKLDAEFEEITEGEERAKVEVGMRNEEVSANPFHPSLFCLRTCTVAHLEKRVEAMEGKAMITSVELKSVWLAISASLRLSA